MSTPAARDLAATLRGDPIAWTWAQLVDRWSRAAARSAVRGAETTQVLPGIYAATVHSQSFAVRSHAAHLWCGPESVVVGAGAAAIWDICDVPREVLIATKYGTNFACPPWLKVKRMASIPPAASWGPRAMAMPAWAAVTSYATAHPRTRDAFLYRTVQAKLATVSELREVAAILPRLNGRKHFAQVLAAINEGSESHLETVGLRKVFNTKDFADFVRQHWVTTPGGNFRLDMFHPPSMTAVELDGGDHGKAAKRQYDVTRDVWVAGEGILTLRLTGPDIYERAAWCRAAVCKVIETRLA